MNTSLQNLVETTPPEAFKNIKELTWRRGTNPEIMQTWKIHVSERKNHYLLVLSVHDEGYSRNERSALNLDRSLTSRNQSTLRLILTTFDLRRRHTPGKHVDKYRVFD